jgi:hypothetical protein
MKKWVIVIIVAIIVAVMAAAVAEKPIPFQALRACSDYAREPPHSLGDHARRLGCAFVSLAVAYTLGTLITVSFAAGAERLSVDSAYFGEEFPDQIKRVLNAFGSTYLIIAAIRTASGHPNLDTPLGDLHSWLFLGVMVALLAAVGIGGLRRLSAAKARIHAVVRRSKSARPRFFQSWREDPQKLFGGDREMADRYWDFGFSIGFLPRSFLLTAFVAELLKLDPATILVLGLFLISGTYTWITAIRLGTACSSGENMPGAMVLVCRAFLNSKMLLLYAGVLFVGYLLWFGAPSLFRIPVHAAAPSGEAPLIMANSLREWKGPLLIAGSNMLVIAAFVVAFGSLVDRIPSLLFTIVATIVLGQIISETAWLVDSPWRHYLAQVALGGMLRVAAGGLLVRGAWSYVVDTIKVMANVLVSLLRREIARPLYELNILAVQDQACMALPIEWDPSIGRWYTAVVHDDEAVMVPTELLPSGVDVYKTIEQSYGRIWGRVVRMLGIAPQIDFAVVDLNAALLIVSQYDFAIAAVLARRHGWTLTLSERGLIRKQRGMGLERFALPGSEPTPRGLQPAYGAIRVDLTARQEADDMDGERESERYRRGIHVLPDKMFRLIASSRVDAGFLPEPYASFALESYAVSRAEGEVEALEDRAPDAELAAVRDLGASVLIARRGAMELYTRYMQSLLWTVYRRLGQLERLGRGIVDRVLLDAVSVPFAGRVVEGRAAAIQRALMRVQFSAADFADEGWVRAQVRKRFAGEPRTLAKWCDFRAAHEQVHRAARERSDQGC